MAAQACRKIQILSDALEPVLYDRADFIQHCKQMVLRHPSCSMQLLVKRSESLRSMEHRLLDLMQRLPSRIVLKVCHYEDRDLPQSWLSVDEAALLLKSQPGLRAAMKWYQHEPRLNADYQKRFAKLWERAEIASELRRLAL